MTTSKIIPAALPPSAANGSNARAATASFLGMLLLATASHAAQAADTTPAAETSTTRTMPDDDSAAMPDEGTAVDNTRLNKRDRNSDTLTPDEQSGSEPDRELTASIRRAVIAQPGISMAGQNIKIITADNRVTLRGPVKDEAERRAIEKTVRGVAGKAKVDNQLETAGKAQQKSSNY